MAEPCVIHYFSHIRLFVTLWTVVHQASLSTRFSRQEYWSGLPCAPPGDLPDPGIEHTSPALQADSLTTRWATWEVWNGRIGSARHLSSCGVNDFTHRTWCNCFRTLKSFLQIWKTCSLQEKEHNYQCLQIIWSFV